jgi:type II secretory pathway component HofQ
MMLFYSMLSFAEPSAVWISSAGEVREEKKAEREGAADGTKKDQMIEPIPTISLELEDADIHGVIRLFADLTGKNFVLDDSVQGKVTVFLKDVPWDQALEAILMSKGFIMVPIGQSQQEGASLLLIQPI